MTPNLHCFALPPSTKQLIQFSPLPTSSLCRHRPLCTPTKPHRSHINSGVASMQMAAELSIEQLLSSTDFLARIRGINRIEEAGTTTQRINLLIPIATQDANQQVRYAALSRLSNLDAQELTPEDRSTVLEAARFVLVNDKESSCQSGAADLIAGLKLSDGFDDLVDAFNGTSDWMLKFSIAAGLGEMGDPKAFDFLTSILKEQGQDFLLVSAAIGALGELGDKRGIEVVERYLKDEDPSIRERAAIAHSMLIAAGTS